MPQTSASRSLKRNLGEAAELPRVQALALVYLAAERGGNALDALADAAEALGLPDDPDLNTRPSDNLARKMRLWRARARALETGIPAPRADAA